MNSPIYDIKVNLFSFVITNDFIIIIGFLLFLVLFYYLLEYFYNYNSSDKKFIKLTKNKINTDFNDKKQFLLNNIESLSRLEFYSIAGSFIRDKLSDKYDDKNIYNMTFKEISLKYSGDMVVLLEDVYYMEFNNSLKDSLDKRKEIIIYL